MAKKNGFWDNRQNGAIATNEMSKEEAVQQLNLASLEDLYLSLYDLEQILRSKNEDVNHPALQNPESVQSIPVLFVNQLKELNKMAQVTVTNTEQNGVSSKTINKEKLQQITNETDPNTLTALFNAMETVVGLHQLHGKTEAEKDQVLKESFANLDNWTNQAFLIGYGSRKVELLRANAAEKIKSNVEQIRTYQDLFNAQKAAEISGFNSLNELERDTDKILNDLQCLVYELEKKS